MATNRKFIAKNGLLTPDVTTPLVTNAGTLAVSATGSNVITASTNNAERLRIDNDGNVGINTTSPTERLHVNGRVRLGSQASNTTHAVRADRTLTGGDGINAIGNLTANRTISVDSTVVRTSGNQSIGGTKTFTSSVEINTSGAAELVLHGNERGSIGQGAFTDGLGNTANNDDTWIRTRFRSSSGSQNLNTVFRDAGGITMYGPSSSGVIWNINTSGQLTTGNVPWARLSGYPTITAGDGLSGGGSLNTNRTISVDSSVVRTSGNQTIGGNKQFTGFTGFGVAPSTSYRIYSRSDSNAAYIRTNSSSSGVYALRVRTGANSTALTVMGNARVGIGTSSPTESLHVIGRVRLGSQANATTHAVRADRTISTGSGLSGGGNLTANRTLSVDSSVVRTSGNQTISGNKRFADRISFGNGTVQRYYHGMSTTRSPGHRFLLFSVTKSGNSQNTVYKLRFYQQSGSNAAESTASITVRSNTLPSYSVRWTGETLNLGATPATIRVFNDGSGTLYFVAQLNQGCQNVVYELLGYHRSNYNEVSTNTSSGDFNTSGLSEIGESTRNKTYSYNITVGGNLVLGSAGTATNQAVRADRTISTGSGLSGGGNLTSNRTLSVDSSVVRTSGNQSISGTKTFTGQVRAEIVQKTTSGNFAVRSAASNLRLGGSSNVRIYTGSSSSSDGTERMRITSSGVGIGTTSPSERLHVVGNILASGTIQAGSDHRFKTNIETIGDAIHKITQLRGVYYTRTDTDNADQVHTGVIAQEVLPVLPEVVGGDEQSGYSVAYGHMAGLFIEAIKSQQATIEQQQATIEQLDRRVRKLE